MNFSRIYLLAAFLAYVFFLVEQLPAAAIGIVLNKNDMPVRLFGTSGTWLDGSAAIASLGSFQMKNVCWRVSPASFLVGRIQATVEGKTGGSGWFRSRVRAGPGTITLSETEGRVPAAILARIFKTGPGVELQGTIVAGFPLVEIQNGIIRRIDGGAVWEEAALGGGVNLQLGKLKADFPAGNSGVKGVLTDSGGPLSAEGVLSLLPDGGYTFSGRFAVRNPGNSELLALLKLAGRDSGNGRIAVALAGDTLL